MVNYLFLNLIVCIFFSFLALFLKEEREREIVKKFVNEKKKKIKFINKNLVISFS